MIRSGSIPESRHELALTGTLAGVSDIGRIRSTNEDEFFLSTEGVQLVADGLGGLPAGEVASGTAVAAAAAALCGRDFSAVEEAEAGRLLRTAFEAANDAVSARAQADLRCAGMATTLIAVLISRSMLHVAHVGDVRAYRLGKAGLERLTDDHTRAWEQVLSGALSEQAARRSPHRNALTRVLGYGTVEPSIRSVPLAFGDVILLCSDGLWEPVPERDLCRILSDRGTDARTRAIALADAALEAGGPDNITAVVYQHDRG